MKKEDLLQVIKFSAVGVINTAVDYGVFYVMLSVAGINKSISQVIATAVAMCGSYIINKYWTFSQKGRADTKQIVKFIFTNLISMSTTIIFMNVFYDFLHVHEWLNSLLLVTSVSYRLDGDIAVMMCKVIASVFSLVINFLFNKFWVFKKMSKEE